MEENQEKEQQEQQKNLKIKKSKLEKLTLAILKPGRYLMLNQNKYISIKEPSSVLLIENSFNTHSVALVEDDLVLVEGHEFKIQ